MYESPKYNVQKIKDFADTITGFEAVLNTAKLFQAAENNRNNPNPKTLSARLLRLALRQRGTTPSSGKFPYSEMGELLGYFRDIFDEKQAKKDGTIKPKVMVVYALLPCSVLHLIPFNSILSCFLYPFTPLSLLYFYYLTLFSPLLLPPPADRSQPGLRQQHSRGGRHQQRAAGVPTADEGRDGRQRACFLGDKQGQIPGG
jgi:hypothetical protein